MAASTPGSEGKKSIYQMSPLDWPYIPDLDVFMEQVNAAMASINWIAGARKAKFVEGDEFDGELTDAMAEDQKRVFEDVLTDVASRTPGQLRGSAVYKLGLQIGIFIKRGLLDMDQCQRAVAAAMPDDSNAPREFSRGVSHSLGLRQKAMHDRANPDWAGAAAAQGLDFEKILKGTQGPAACPAGGAADFQQEWEKTHAANADAYKIIANALREMAEGLVSKKKAAESARPARIRLLKRIAAYGLLGAIEPEDFANINTIIKGLAGAQDAEVAPTEHDTGIGQIVIQLLKGGPGKKFADAEREAERLARKNSAGATSDLFYSWGPFTMTWKGLEAEVEKGSGASKEVIMIPVAGAFEILGRSRDQHREGWGMWLRWKDADGGEHTRLTSSELIHGDPKLLCALLVASGLWVNSGAQDKLKQYLGGVREIPGRVTVASRTGWVSLPDGARAFVLPQATVKPEGAEEIVLAAETHTPYASKGTLEDWKAGVGTISGDHVMFTFAVSQAFAGPLLAMSEQEGGGFHFFSKSSKGKTTLLCAGASVWGKGAAKTGGYVRSWRGTGNGLEGAATGSSDTYLPLDELGQLEAVEAKSVFYMLAGGVGKQRADRSGALRNPKTWEVMLASTGEMPIETKITEVKGQKAHAGQLVRLLDIPANSGKGSGIFDTADMDKETSAKLINRIKREATTAYGVAGPAFVRQLIEHAVDEDGVHALVAAFVKKHTPVGADEQVIRAVQRFALVAAGGELATKFGVTPWAEGAAEAAAKHVLDCWVKQRGGIAAAEDTQAVASVRGVIEMYGEVRFDEFGKMATNFDGTPMKDAKTGEPVMEYSKPSFVRYGFRKGAGAAREWYVLPEMWKVEFCRGADPVLVAQTLRDKGMLRASEADHLTMKVRLGEAGFLRVYVITAKILDA